MRTRPVMAGRTDEQLMRDVRSGSRETATLRGRHGPRMRRWVLEWSKTHPW